jgi:hypothetical protein
VVTLIFWVWVFPRLFAPPERGLLQ